MKRATVNIATSGDNEIIPGIEGSTIAIHQIVLWAREEVNVILKDGNEAINGIGFNWSAKTGFVDDSKRPMPLGIGNAFSIELDGDAEVTGWVLYNRIMP